MNKLFNSFYDGYINTKLPSKNNINIRSISTPEELLIHKNSFLNEDNFISNKIKNEIKKYNYCYEIKINPSKSIISFYPYESNKYMPQITIYYLMKNKKEPSLKYISSQLRRICFISNIYSKHNSDSTPLKCWFCPTSNMKLLPQISSSTPSSTPIILGPNNVNSGLSIPDIRHIKIWRKEELNKVLTHELIHTYKLDKAIYNTNEVNDYIRTILNISPSNEINVNEAYTEGLTTILNTIFIMIDDKINNNINTQSQYKKYKSILNTELDFSINQTAKILHYNGFNNINELFIKPVKNIKNINNINNINNNHKKHKWKQNSNVLSYYLIKTALLNNLNDFIKFLKSTNCFKVTNQNIPQFKLLLNKSLRNKNFIKKVNTKMRNINTNTHLRNTNTKLKENSSLRMTFFG